MAKGDDLQDRLINFAVMIITFCSKLPKTEAGRHIAGQLVRSGTAPAPHYGEARSAESKRDFLHKLRIALKEMNESAVWLEIIERAEMVPKCDMVEIRTECDELCRILGASVRSVMKNAE
jgi:four helix bundle protein